MMKNTWRELREMDRNVWIRFIGETLNGIAMMMLMPFFALYLKDKVDSLLEVGLLWRFLQLLQVLDHL